METSQEMQQRAVEASAGQPIRETDAYSVYALSEGFMDHFVLVLFKDGQDFPADRQPEGVLEMKVEIDGRQGYLMEHSRAEGLSE